MGRRPAVLLLALLVADGAAAEDAPRVLEATAAVAPAEVLPGASAELAVSVTLEPGWHVNAHVPSEPYLIPTELTLTMPPVVQAGEVRYPPGEERRFAFNPGKALATYAGTFRLTATLAVGGDAFVDRPVSIRGALRYQACNDTRCLPPRTEELTVRLLIRTAAEERGGGAGVKPPATSAPGGFATDWILRGDAFAYLGAFVLGLLLNLTPCVYPLIAVTVAFFGGQSGGSRARVVGLALAYVAGIALTFSALGTASALSGAAFGMALQQPAVLVLIAATLLVLAAANFGLYELRTPAALSRWAGRSGAGAGGALFMGLTMGLVAAPCVGPVLAGLILAVGARQDVLFGASVFLVLSLGLGAPYVGLAALASAARGLPRSGGWLTWMERLLGLVLIGLALFYVEPLLPDGARQVAWTLLLLGGGIYLGFLEPTGSEWARFVLMKRGLGFAAIAAALWTLGAAEGPAPIRWESFTAQALARARERGAPSVVDFSAEWCIPSREMDATTFHHPAVVEESRGFAMLRADVTVVDDATDTIMREHAVLGVPTYLFFTPEGEEAERLVGYVSAEEFLRAMRVAGAG